MNNQLIRRLLTRLITKNVDELVLRKWPNMRLLR